ncbi:hypothetical protein KVV02_007660 [Mortierella alpina]|uniref:Zn(2)-C6 fungal-type domain-containing protein n=2 Tax=Mortierellaceae TaxID=4854 RepID=A0A9P8D132_MORAP|nr:hypothetical protein KVV02_007660 [Mortierella alpina]
MIFWRAFKPLHFSKIFFSFFRSLLRTPHSQLISSRSLPSPQSLSPISIFCLQGACHRSASVLSVRAGSSKKTSRTCTKKTFKGRDYTDLFCRMNPPTDAPNGAGTTQNANNDNNSSSQDQQGAGSSSSSTAAMTQQQLDDEAAKKKRAGPKRRKVTHACVYCRRSHMTCDDGRPCQRCIKRNIGHLCHDEPKPSAAGAASNQQSTSASSSNAGTPAPSGGISRSPEGMTFKVLTEAADRCGKRFHCDFLESLGGDSQNIFGEAGIPINTTEKFFLTAADPSDGTNEDRLTQVINAKFEAGFLKPYNYVNGYSRLQKYMDSNMSNISRQRILNVMGTFRPAFRTVAQSLTDIDLVLVEEAFERLLLDYDRVFSSMGIPACLWRRTGEIYKGNKEFASLVNVPLEMLREGRLCIYELMAEESAVNYWEKYGNIAFDAGQKAVLTSCLLKNPDPESQNVISCCFSFTIRRDKYNIPTVIVGNFLPVSLG